TITLELARRVWGYRARFDGRDLLLEVRRPPVIDREHPLRGRTVVLDPGHPPLGAKGPTGLWEPVATLAVALKAKTLLERAGAVVTEFRVRDLGIGRGDYALVRPTWMPAALTEGLFIMLPEQEAVLASEDGQWRYARGVVSGIEAFLRDRARDP